MESRLPTWESDEDAVKDVFAAFGLAYYQLGCLEYGLRSLLCTAWYDAREALSQADYDSRFQELSRLTLGQLVQEAGQQRKSDPPVLDEIRDMLNTRNRLAHHYFSQRAAAFTTVFGRSEMYLELMDLAEDARRLHEELSRLARVWGNEHGIGDDAIVEEQQALVDEYWSSRFRLWPPA